MRGVNYEKVENLCPNNLSLSTSSLVVNTSTDDCSLKCGSLDQIGIFNSSASAKKGTSVLCEINPSALSSNERGEFFNSINLESNETSSENFSFAIFDLAQIISEYLDNSSISSSGANNVKSYSFSSLLVNESDLNNENTTLVSTTSSIYALLCFSDMIRLNFLPSLRHSSSVNSDFEKSFSSLSNISSCSIFFKNDSLASADQLMNLDLSIFCLSSSGIDKVIDTILVLKYDTFVNRSHIFKLFDFVNVTGVDCITFRTGGKICAG